MILKERYEIKKVIHQSNYASTYYGIDQATENEIIIKELNFSNLDYEKGLDLFKREALILKQLKHEYIPRFIDFLISKEESKERFFLVQSYLKGQNLKEYIFDHERLTEERALIFLKELLNILSYIHSLNPPVIHRDINPSNILIQESGNVALVDFGSVKVMKKNDMTIVGTYGFMPFEQFGGEAYPSSDVYSTGMSMIFWLTHFNPAKLPKEKGRLNFKNHCNISDNFYQILQKMSEPQLEDRYQSAEEVLADIEKLEKKSVQVETDAVYKEEYPITDYHLPEPSDTKETKEVSEKHSKFLNQMYVIILIILFFSIISLFIFIGMNKESSSASPQQQQNNKIEEVTEPIELEKEYQPLPNGFREAKFGISHNNLKEIYQDIEMKSSLFNLDFDDFKKLKEYQLEKLPYMARKADLFGYEFKVLYYFHEDQLFHIICTKYFESESLFQDAYTAIEQRLNENYGPYDKKEKKNSNDMMNFIKKYDFYQWKDSNVSLKFGFFSEKYIDLIYTDNSLASKRLHYLEKQKQEKIRQKEEAARKKQEEDKKRLEELEKKRQTGEASTDI
ncbi:MAG: serine/threonine protein kinase [Spirochaetes bacterium]|nr:serine/threonine protein kinase [Spirochaetota bacterium]